MGGIAQCSAVLALASVGVAYTSPSQWVWPAPPLHNGCGLHLPFTMGVACTSPSQWVWPPPPLHKVVTVSEDDEDPSLFHAMQVSIGLLGVITEVTLHVEEAYYLEETRTHHTLDYCLDHLHEIAYEPLSKVWLDFHNDFCVHFTTRRSNSSVGTSAGVVRTVLTVSLYKSVQLSSPPPHPPHHSPPHTIISSPHLITPPHHLVTPHRILTSSHHIVSSPRHTVSSPIISSPHHTTSSPHRILTSSHHLIPSSILTSSHHLITSSYPHLITPTSSPP